MRVWRVKLPFLPVPAAAQGGVVSGSWRALGGSGFMRSSWYVLSSWWAIEFVDEINLRAPLTSPSLIFAWNFFAKFSGL